MVDAEPASAMPAALASSSAQAATGAAHDHHGIDACVPAIE
jgi:hypothetical protein